MKKIITVAILAILTVILNGCTENMRAKTFGGNATVELPPGQKLVNVTWKDDELWYLTRSARPGESTETFTFSEKSSFGILEGKVTIKEH